MSQTENNKRIAKNTLLLYVRMLLTMIVSLFTVRIVLNALGASDYGILNVVGGIVIMFSFLSNTMMGASQRFLSFAIGNNDIDQQKKIFNISIIIYLILAIIIIALSETLGLWFLNHKMTIPIERLEAANWIFQFAIVSFIFTILAIPYNAAIIAHENMSIYAYVSIIEVTLKLIIVFLLAYLPFDKLKLYSILLASVSGIVFAIYKTICKRRYVECRVSFMWDKVLFKDLISYSGWILFGSIANVFNTQGINILLNLFFGPVINASRAISTQINSNVSQLVMNFLTAVNPQIIKHYATGNKGQMMKLVFQSSKYAYFLLFIFAMPVLFETNYILKIWLKTIPDYVVIFTQLLLINALIESLSYSLQFASQATGKVKLYQIVVGGTYLLNVPFSYLALYLKYPPQSTIYISIFMSIICLVLRLLMLRKMVDLSITSFLKNVIFSVSIISITSIIGPLILFSQMEESFFRLIVIILSAGISTLISIYYLGISKEERIMLVDAAKNRIFRKFKKTRE